MSVHIHDRYTFHITAPNGTTWQAYPRNATLEWKWEKNSDYGFFRKLLETPLVFVSDTANSIDDFDRLLLVEESDDRCNFILIDVFLICGEVETLWWNGRISCTLGEWDKSKCRLRVKAEANDDYTCLLESWEKELDFASALESRTISIGPEYFVEAQICTWFEPVTPDDAFITLIDNLNEGVFSDAILENIRALLLINVFLHCPDFLDAGSSTWKIFAAGHGPSTGFVYPIRITIVRETAPGTCDGGDPVAPDEDPAWVLLTDNCPTDSTWVRPLNLIYTPGGFTFISRPLHNTYRLSDVLQWYTDTAFTCGVPIISNFFNINPDATAPDNEPYQKAAIGLSDVHIQHFSDFVKDDADGPDIKAVIPISLESIIKNLPGNIAITIDNGSLRIEHVSYFRRINMLDLTHADHVELINGFYQYNYNKEKLPKEEVWSWKGETDGKNKDFDGMPIEYSSACVDPENKKKTYSFELFYSNLEYLYGHKADYEDSLDGLMIYSVRDGNVLFDNCPISGLLKMNGHFAISTLHQNYYKWDRPLPTGIMNGQPTQFFRWLRQKQQPDIKVRMCCDDYGTFDPDDLVKTQLGWGEVAEAALESPKSLLKLELLHH